MTNSLMETTNGKTMTSLELVDLINKFRKEEYDVGGKDYKEKLHKTIMRDIRSELETMRDNHNDYFIKSSFVDAQGKKQPCYLLTKIGVGRLCRRWRMTSDLAKTVEYLQSIDMYPHTVEIVDHRKEIEFLHQLKQALIPFNICGSEQYKVGKYRIDYYIESMNVAIEYDENNHKHYTYEQQELRQKLIEEELDCRFIRVTDLNSHAYNIGLVIKELFRLK